MRMTSRVWYAVAIAAVLGGFGGAGLLVWSVLSGIGDGMTRGVVPGSIMLDLADAGTYTIFHESEAVIDGRVYSSDHIDGLRVAVSDEGGGSPVTVKAAGASTRYSLSGHTGVSVLAFDIARPGRYRLTARYDGGKTEPVAVLAVGQGFVGRLIGTIFGAVAAAFAGVIIGLVIALITFFQRRRAQFAVANPTF